MQTFLPYKDFLHSALTLDRVRCWQQVREAKQIFNTLSGLSEGWKNHPAVLMWKGHINALKEYYNAFLKVVLEIHKYNTDYQYFEIEGPIVYPSWLGDEDFHASHRSNLLRKNLEFYSRYSWKEPANLPYIWPVRISK